MRHPYKLTIAFPAATDPFDVFADIARNLNVDWQPNASVDGNAPATHYLATVPLAEYMKDNFDALDKTGLEYKLCDCENGMTVLDEVEITVQRVIVEE